MGTSTTPVGISTTPVGTSTLHIRQRLGVTLPTADAEENPLPITEENITTNNNTEASAEPTLEGTKLVADFLTQGKNCG